MRQKRTKLEQAEARLESARERYQRALSAVEVERARYLADAGWERVYVDAWRSPGGGPLFTSYAAVREQRRREREKARHADRKAGAR